MTQHRGMLIKVTQFHTPSKSKTENRRPCEHISREDIDIFFENDTHFMIGEKIKKGKTETCDNPIFIECIISQLDTFNVWHHRRSLPQKSDGLISLSINQTLIYKLEQGCERVSTLQLNVRNVKGKD